MKSASIYIVLVSVGFVASHCDANGAQSPMEEVREAASSLCTKLSSCETMSPAEMDECNDYMIKYTQYVVDSTSFERCIESKSCDELLSPSSSEVVFEQCADVNWYSFRCVGDLELRYCNNRGVCINLDCEEFCEFAVDEGLLPVNGTLSHVGCGAVQDTEQDGRDVCICYII